MRKWSEIVNDIRNLGGRKSAESRSGKEGEAEDFCLKKQKLIDYIDELQLFRDLIDASSDAIYVVDPDTSSFLEINDQACQALGYSREELLSMGVLDIDARLFQGIEDWLVHAERLRTTKSAFRESIHRTRYGDTFPVELNVRLIERDRKSYIIAISRDVSEQHRIRESIIEENNKLDAVLTALGDGLTVMDTSFRILYQNAVHIQKQGSHVGEYCYSAYQNRKDVCPGCLLVRCFADGKTHRRETSAVTDTGVVHMEVSACPVRDARGRIVAGVETIRDITERRNLEDQLRQAQKMEAVGRLTSGIAHDFNNLLTTIVGYSDLLLMNINEGEDLSPEKLENDLTSIRDAGEKATSLTRQLLAFSRKQVLELQVVDLNQLIEGIAKMLRRLIGEDVQLNLSLDPLLANIKADPGQIEQILMNLAVNARDAMPEGGRLILETQTLVIDELYARQHEGVDSGTYAALIITDTGQGIPRKEQEKIFDPFYTTKPQGKGTGLGLATVHGIVKQHNGSIFVYSEPGRGSTFKILLPVTEESIAASAEEKQSVVLRGEEKILVVDDEASIRSLIVDALQPLGFELLEAASGEDALQACRSMENPPDLLLTDLIMPGMDGRELADRLSGFLPDLKVIYMSGYTDNSLLKGGVLEEGVNYLGKPITPSLLIDKLREVLGRS